MPRGAADSSALLLARAHCLDDGQFRAEPILIPWICFVESPNLGGELGISCTLSKALQRLRRLLEVADHEAVTMACACGRIVEYRPGLLQRRHRIRSDTLVYDLQFRLRCRHCNRRSGFRIAVVDGRGRGDNNAPKRERIVVTGEIARG